MMFVTVLYSSDTQAVGKYTPAELKKMIGSMLIVGFDEERITKESVTLAVNSGADILHLGISPLFRKCRNMANHTQLSNEEIKITKFHYKDK